jgi:hypothetical protein
MNQNLNAHHHPSNPDIVVVLRKKAALCTPAIYAILWMIDAPSLARRENCEQKVLREVASLLITIKERSI